MSSGQGPSSSTGEREAKPEPVAVQNPGERTIVGGAGRRKAQTPEAPHRVTHLVHRQK